MNTENKPVVEQWMRDAARAWYADAEHYQSYESELAEIIARHAPSNQPAPSIWRPVSEKPGVNWVVGPEQILVTDGKELSLRSSKSLGFGQETHWTRTADLLALAPLPKEKTQLEKDCDFIAACSTADGDDFSDQMLKAIAYGRATAKGAAQ